MVNVRACNLWNGAVVSGVMIPKVEDVTVQKYDLQFGINVLGTPILV
jgi:hypothetical protein